MQRRLVLTDEGAGHYMRRMLPPRELKVNALAGRKPSRWWQSEDAHLFVISFGAFFTVFYTFIA